MAIGWFGRLRIEGLVWMLDQQLYDLPRAQRISTRREVRANLIEAATDLGAGEALRRIGGSRRLAEQYLRAEFGDRPRPSWIGAIVAAGLVPMLLNYVFAEAAASFRDGVTAADPHVSGTFVSTGLEYLQAAQTFTFTDGSWGNSGGGWAPLAYAIWVLSVVGAGRLWRIRFSSHVGAARADN
ncbi:hypothetical protein [Actinoplanes awajinensis]|uniref:Uncharacterized protein n=1 Tax=Actinoplanes awajinensis subsp. mycoplanecinus TaxID=135947 RepID=A0A0X3URN9_9ACTN|nr:hypothetical protein [Actinoplanes awajinensis]KUL35281.1 hypothetical protein ADL15_14780 [Actinoplanes awajinensis subsp. mycoplanecinus]